MKIATITALMLSCVTIQAFCPSIDVERYSYTSLNMLEENMSRRKTLATLLSTTAFSSVAIFPNSASALQTKEYEPKFDDLKQIYTLGMSLNGVKAKLSNPENFQDVLVGVRLFNKDIRYYPIYARTFVSKSVKFSADDDSRVVAIKEVSPFTNLPLSLKPFYIHFLVFYINQAAQVIGSLQELLDGHEGPVGDEASKTAIARVEKAQSLIGQFLSASGVEDERIAAYVAAH